MGGAEQCVLTFARHVDRDRIDLRVACIKSIDGNPLAREIEAAGIPVTLLRARDLRDLAALMRLRRFLREEEIDLVHTHLTYADIWGRLAAWSTGRVAVSTLHVPYYFYHWQPRLRDRVIERLARFVRTHVGGPVIAVSDFLRGAVVKRGLPPHRIVTLHNGIELNLFDAPGGPSTSERRAELGLPAGAPVVVMLAVAREGKGHDALLAAMPIVVERRPDIRFLLVGGGPLEPALRERVREMGLNDNVLFTGMRLDRPEMLSLADVFTIPSQNDSFPTTVMEAMAMRLPVVGLQSGGVPEMIVDGETGLLVPPDRAEALASALLELVENLGRARAMGERGRARVEAEFDARIWCLRLEQLYDEILASTR
jgi:glycosyltransferase involved in cell wall biosynthesis